MTKLIQPLARKSMIAVASLAIAGGTFWACSARAEDPKMDDKMMGDHKMMAPMPMSPDDQKMVMEHMDKMKMMAADPDKAEKMTADWAKMMVADEMAKSMAMDPAFQKQVMDMMNDPAMKKAHDEAMKMAQDPEQMKKMKAEIMADPHMMNQVMHQAAMMTMMHDHMMGDMKDKMEEMKK